MADWRQALRSRLRASPAVRAETGQADAVSFNTRPQGGVLPWLVLRVISEGREQNLKGFLERQPARVQIDALARTSEQAVALRRAAEAAVVGAGTFFRITFGRAIIEARPDTGEQTETGFVHLASFDAIFWHD